MIPSLLGIKKGQSQAFTADGKRIPVTVVEAGPCWVTKVEDMPMYKSIQLGFGNTRHISKAEEGHIKKAGLTTKLRFLRSFHVSPVGDLGDVKPGTEIKVGDVFAIGDAIRVTGTSKGKGFAGVVKRHGFAGGPRTHGQSDRERAPGSIGQTTTPGRVYRGKRMAGRMGGERVTQRGLKVVAINPDTNTMTIKGLVPGAPSGLLIIQKEGKAEAKVL
ncbi:50S ribosomal protein L3 [Candidatus Gottesmanbacteria bacterium RIFCSPLOWO2_01_FULL_49_10]|uniref:Large ribosomal subunit protein uL3 n=1 Tax=Candidatus Gottesmanbacteria bacterium RIFCSPLOWO2_01_FULL_49_10 TaxID=1798396 RepID=A0A1F6AXI4_9BACT|nr:MAG: 50S ribosomal protein L3 [Microgenomates group bacterium GW2011_GWA2_47_8]OGG29370.1 MAG: 50S ribosomal protein L3 [Candidatus Gottesmanbacteria bacterium RIFCSPLOWO2_01_FULL_49_10]